MAQLVVSAVGAAVGFAIGGPAGAQIGWAAGSLLAAPTTRTQGPRLQDLKVTTSSYGQPIAYIEGHPRVSGNIIWASEKREIATTEDVSGKGGGQEYTSYTYEIDVLILLSANEISGVRRIWSNSKLVWTGADDATADSLTASVTDAPWEGFTFYSGAASQLPDPTYEAAVGIGNAPAYRGRGSILIRSLDLGNGGQLPNLTFEVGATPLASKPGFLLRFDNPSSPNVYPDEVTSNVWSLDNTAPLTDVRVVASTSRFGGGSLQVSMSTGVSNRIRCDFTEYYLTNNSWCFQCWFFHDGVAADSQTKLFHLIGGGPNVILWHNPLRGGLKLEGSGFTNIAVAAIGVDVWHFVEAKCDGSNVRLFVNGVLQATRAFTSPVGGLRFSILEIGVFTGGASTWKDYIDDVRLIFDTSRGTTSTVPTGPMENDVAPLAFELTPAPLNDVVSRLCLRAGLTAEQFDATALAAKTVRSMAVSQVTAARTIIENLAAAYLFEAVESDKLKFVLRGGSIAATLPFEDMGAAEGEATEALPLRLSNDTEAPAQVTIRFPNVFDDYQDGSESSDRLLGPSNAVQVSEIPIGFTPAEAKTLADIVVMDIAASLRSFGPVGLTLAQSRLEPTDVVLLTDQTGSTWRGRILKERLSAGIKTIEGVIEDATVLSSTSSTDNTDRSSTIVAAVGDTTLALLDIPLLRDADNSTGFYAAVKGASPWPGAAVFRSTDAVTYTQTIAIAEATKIGVCTTTLGGWSGGTVFDEMNSVTVNIGTQTLSSVTRDAILTAGSNAAVIGSELIQYQTATLVSTGVYTLTGLLRGCRGTEWAMTGHAASERFVALPTSGAGLRRIAQEITDVGVVRNYKGVTSGKTVAAATAQAFTLANVSQKPFAPVDLRAVDAGSGNFSLTWLRRTRLASTFTGPLGSVVPLGESSESYSVDVVRGGSVISTTASATPSATVAAIATDVVRVYQVSATVDRGYPASITL